MFVLSPPNANPINFVLQKPAELIKMPKDNGDLSGFIQLNSILELIKKKKLISDFVVDIPDDKNDKSIVKPNLPPGHAATPHHHHSSGVSF